MSTPGNRDGDRRDPAGQGMSGGSRDAAGSHSVDDDLTEEYVPGMYSGGSADEIRPSTSPIPASRTTDTTRSPEVTGPGMQGRTDTRAVPVTATRDHRPARDLDTGNRDLDRDLDRSPAPGTTARPLPSLEDRKLIHQREKEHFGGMKFGSAFFGWLTATGLFVILTALAGSVAALFGYGSDLTTADLTTGSAELQATGITAAVVLGVILLASYYAGGYVAGRMARFSGLLQGVAVWLWALIVAVVLTIIGLIAGNRIDVPAQFGSIGVPALGDLTGPGLIGLLVVAAIALVGAVLGGLTGMRYHRRIDRMDFDAPGER
ncbi:TIGR04086 family membrane protein [Arthrobacter sp. RIT-PI-e]|uniref:TIGR04086 family membrane protein n=1 Tax=Arthrobacter sp. RIT-PI-e TaxID=1681197 RepID=UPI000A440CB2|nr:TIGR04086 family membrane protein [Arthrobacter sp. RIT-PI-e]